jgi:hypothetical protein
MTSIKDLPEDKYRERLAQFKADADSAARRKAVGQGVDVRKLDAESYARVKADYLAGRKPAKPEVDDKP